MVRLKVGFALAALAAVVLVAPRPAAAQGTAPPVTITVDELGNSRGLPSGGQLSPDPANGGIPALTYNLPFVVTPGTVVLREGGANTDHEGPPSDVIFFEPHVLAGQSTLHFYSDNSDGVDALADAGIPEQPIEPLKFIPEVGPEGQNGAIYTPLPGEPGFAVNGPAVTYDLISDGVVPEPNSLALLLTGGLPMLGFLRRRRA